ncbi:MAG: hypothetical protein U0269_01155 [Polyangiales bacterium]
MKTTMVRWAALVGAMAVGSIASEARADLLPPPDTSGCAERDAGAACVMPNGAPGQCRVDIDTRRNRRFTRCEAVPECEVVAVGGVCHGFGGRPAHCREIIDDQTRRPFRMCVADESSYAALNDASVAESPEPAPVTPAIAPTPRVARDAPASPSARSRCSVTVVGAGSRGAVLAVALAMSVASVRRRR